MSLDTISLCLLAISGILSVALLWSGRGWSMSIVFCYLLSYQLMELGLKAIGGFTDLPYIAFALAINATFFYLFLNRPRARMALIIGFDTIYAGANIWLIQSGIHALDHFYGHVGIAVSLLLLADGVNRGIRFKNYTDSDSFNFDIKSLARALPSSERAKD